MLCLTAARGLSEVRMHPTPVTVSGTTREQRTSRAPAADESLHPMRTGTPAGTVGAVVSLTKAMSARSAFWLAWSVCALSLVLTALGILLLILNSSVVPSLFYGGPNAIAAGVTFSTLGAFVASRRPEHPIGWLFWAIGFCAAAGFFCGQYAIYTLLAQPGALPAGEAAAWIRSLSPVVAGGIGVPDGYEATLSITASYPRASTRGSRRGACNVGAGVLRGSGLLLRTAPRRRHDDRDMRPRRPGRDCLFLGSWPSGKVVSSDADSTKRRRR